MSIVVSELLPERALPLGDSRSSYRAMRTPRGESCVLIATELDDEESWQAICDLYHKLQQSSDLPLLATKDIQRDGNDAYILTDPCPVDNSLRRLLAAEAATIKDKGARLAETLSFLQGLAQVVEQASERGIPLLLEPSAIAIDRLPGQKVVTGDYKILPWNLAAILPEREKPVESNVSGMQDSGETLRRSDSSCPVNHQMLRLLFLMMGEQDSLVSRRLSWLSSEGNQLIQRCIADAGSVGSCCQLVEQLQEIEAVPPVGLPKQAEGESRTADSNSSLTSRDAADAEPKVASSGDANVWPELESTPGGTDASPERSHASTRTGQTGDGSGKLETDDRVLATTAQIDEFLDQLGGKSKALAAPVLKRLTNARWWRLRARIVTKQVQSGMQALRNSRAPGGKAEPPSESK